MTKKRPFTLRDVQSVLLLGAIGDALGAPIEFQYDGFGRQAPAALSAEWTDDTQMTLFVAESLADVDGRTRTGAVRAITRWYRTQSTRPDRLEPLPADDGSYLMTRPEMHVRRAPGRTCMDSARRLTSGESFTLLDPPNGSGGCGAAMRSAPFGLAYGDPRVAFDQAARAGVLTHGSPEAGYVPAAALAYLVSACVHARASLRDAITALLSDDTNPINAITLPTALRGLIMAASDPAFLVSDAWASRLVDVLGDGWAGHHAVAIAIYCALRYEECGDVTERALWRAVAHRGDSDSTGAITGNLLGAIGAPIPEEWLTTLQPKAGVEIINAVATRFAHVFAPPTDEIVEREE